MSTRAPVSRTARRKTAAGAVGETRGGKSREAVAANVAAVARVASASVDKGAGTFATRALARDMAAKGLSTRQIAEKMGCHFTTVARMLKHKEDEIATTMAGTLTAGLPTRMQTIMTRIAAELETRDISGAPLHHLAMLFGILFDKHRLATGQATSNVSFLVRVQAQSEQAIMAQIKGPPMPAIDAPCPADDAREADMPGSDDNGDDANQHG